MKMEQRTVILTKLALPAVLLIVFLVSCAGPGTNGGGDASGGPSGTAVKLDFDETNSGYILKGTTGSFFLRSTDDTYSGTTVTTLYVGDAAFGQSERAFLSFDLDLPSDATEILSARLYLYPNFYTSIDPFPDLGDLQANSVDYGSFAANDYYTTVTGGPWTLATSVDSEKTWISADVSSAVRSDWSSPGNTTQFRIAFETENDGDNAVENVRIEGDENDPNAPYLEVVYR